MGPVNFEKLANPYTCHLDFGFDVDTLKNFYTILRKLLKFNESIPVYVSEEVMWIVFENERGKSFLVSLNHLERKHKFQARYKYKQLYFLFGSTRVKLPEKCYIAHDNGLELENDDILEEKEYITISNPENRFFGDYSICFFASKFRNDSEAVRYQVWVTNETENGFDEVVMVLRNGKMVPKSSKRCNLYIYNKLVFSFHIRYFIVVY